MARKSMIEKLKEEKEKQKVEKVKKIKESSIKSYYNRLSSLMKKLNVDIDYEDDLSKYFNDIKKLIEDSDYSDNTKKANYIMLSSIGQLFNFTESQMKYFNDRMNELNEVVEKKTATHELTNRETENWLTLEEYEKIMQTQKDKIVKLKLIDTYSEVKQVLKYLIILFMRYFPARNNELTNCQIYTKTDMPDDVDKMDDKFNYIILDENDKSAIFYKNNYKTDNIYKSRQYNLKPIVASELIKYYPILHQWGQNNFLFDRNGNAITPNNLTRWLNSIFKKNVSSQMIRKIIRTQASSTTLNKAMELMEEADMFGHSVETSLKSYMKKVPK